MGGIFGDDFGISAHPVLQADPLTAGLQAQGPGGILGGMPAQFTNVGGRKLPLNEDGTVTLFHSTSRPAAEKIVQSKIIKSNGEPSVYFSTEPFGTGYGEHTVAVKLNPRDLRIDDEFPSGRADFRIDKPNLLLMDAQHFLPPK